MALGRRSDEAGRVVTLVGHGGSGVGSSRARVEDGQRRAATTQVDSVDANWLYLSFDAPPRGTALEGAPGPGDSGGPALLSANNQQVVVGVSSAGYDGELGPGTYGAVDVFTRVSTHLKWLEATIAAPLSAAPRVQRVDARVQGTALPDSPAGRRYAAFLKAMHANTDSAILAFLQENFDARELAARSAQERLPNFRRLAARLHDAKIVSIDKSEPLALAVKLRGAAGDTMIELICAPEAPNRLLDSRRLD